MPEKIVQLNEEVIKGQLKELVRGSVEETLQRLSHTIRGTNGSIVAKRYFLATSVTKKLDHNK